MLHSLTVCRVSDEKSSKILFVPLYLMFFHFCFFLLFYLWKIFRFSIYHRFSAIWLWFILVWSCFAYSVRVLLRFWAQWALSVHQIKKKSWAWYYLLFFFFCIPLLCYWKSKYMCLRSFQIVPGVPFLFIMLINFSPMFWIISIGISSIVVIFLLQYTTCC